MKIFGNYQNRITFRQNTKTVNKDEQKTSSSPKESLTSKTAISCFAILGILGWFYFNRTSKNSGKNVGKSLGSKVKKGIGEIIDASL